jgi:hypothetical protein
VPPALRMRAQSAADTFPQCSTVLLSLVKR